MVTVIGVSSSPVSLDSTSTTVGKLNEQPRRSSTATGVLLAFSVTVTVTVAMAWSPSMSATRYLNVTVPTNQLLGVKVTVRLLFTAAAPNCGASKMVSSPKPSSRPESFFSTLM